MVYHIEVIALQHVRIALVVPKNLIVFLDIEDESSLLVSFDIEQGDRLLLLAFVMLYHQGVWVRAGDDVGSFRMLEALS